MRWAAAAAVRRCMVVADYGLETGWWLSWLNGAGGDGDLQVCMVWWWAMGGWW